MNFSNHFEWKVWLSIYKEGLCCYFLKLFERKINGIDQWLHACNCSLHINNQFKKKTFFLGNIMIMHPHCKILISTDLFRVDDCQLCNNTSGIIFHRSYSFLTKSWDTRIKINNKRDFFMFYTSTCCPKDIWIDCSFCSAKWKVLSYWKSCKVECCTNIANAKVIFYPLKIWSVACTQAPPWGAENYYNRKEVPHSLPMSKTSLSSFFWYVVTNNVWLLFLNFLHWPQMLKYWVLFSK